MKKMKDFRLNKERYDFLINSKFNKGKSSRSGGIYWEVGDSSCPIDFINLFILIGFSDLVLLKLCFICEGSHRNIWLKVHWCELLTEWKHRTNNKYSLYKYGKWNPTNWHGFLTSWLWISVLLFICSVHQLYILTRRLISLLGIEASRSQFIGTAMSVHLLCGVLDPTYFPSTKSWRHVEEIGAQTLFQQGFWHHPQSAQPYFTQP